MRVVVQRVTRASVSEGEVVLGEIGLGAVVLAGIGADDEAATVDRMADKLAGLRYFRDADGRTNLAIADVGGSFLVVSQFTLYGDTRKGNRPSFVDAAPPEEAEPLYERVRAALNDAQGGRFGARMEVDLVNDGPVTLVVET